VPAETHTHTEAVEEGSIAPTTGRGRPRLVYRVSPNAGSRWGALGPYERLTGLLAEALRTGATPAEVGRRAVAATEPAAPPDADPVEVVTAAMARNGFDPDVRRRGCTHRHGAREASDV
jgi:hypothetical protein